MINEFSKNCLELYSFLCTYEHIDKEQFFQMCVEERLNNLVELNSKQLDDTLNRLERYIDELITTTIPYVRCNNYKQKQKNNIKQNINYISKLFKKYNKSCISSTHILHKLMKEVNKK